MKKIILLLFLFLCIQLYSQKDYEFGDVSKDELEMTVYEKDTTAGAVVLYEQGDVEFFERNDSYHTRTTVYKKIKILSKKGFNEATISLIIYSGKLNKERLREIKGIIHNGNVISELNEDDIYETNLTENFKKISFALPNVKVGSVIEYSYILETPFKFRDWSFQAYIPKVKSIFNAKIPIDFEYNRSLIGPLDLNKSKTVIQKYCYPNRAMDGFIDCEKTSYVMLDVPAFIEEDYMTTPSNFISRVAFETAYFENFDGGNWLFTQNWKEVDKYFNYDDSIGGQLRRVSFFKKNLPKEILNEKDYLTRAIKAFQFIQNHYSWNNKYNLYGKMFVRKAFNTKIGSVGEINLSLINTLNACDIEADLVLLSTRDHGIPSKVHPVIPNFNYLIVKIEIDKKTIFLDASDKTMAFGMLPFRCLNGEARIMDFKYGSYWEEVKTNTVTKQKVNLLLSLDTNGNSKGKMRISHYGYDAIDAREKFNLLKEDNYLLDIEDENDNLIITNYSQKNFEDKEKSFTENFVIEIENDNSIPNKIIINPFFIATLKVSPFKLNSRLYPVDFGFTKKNEFIISIDIPNNFQIESMPSDKSIELPNNKGRLIYSTKFKNNKISIYFKYSIDATIFYSNEYENLKEFFNQIILSQNEPIILRHLSN